jgi:hypothetical protein
LIVVDRSVPDREPQAYGGGAFTQWNAVFVSSFFFPLAQIFED